MHIRMWCITLRLSWFYSIDMHTYSQKYMFSLSLPVSLHLVVLMLHVEMHRMLLSVSVSDSAPSSPSLRLPITPKSHPRKSIFSSVKFHLPLRLRPDTVSLSFPLCLSLSLSQLKESADTLRVSAVSVSYFICFRRSGENTERAFLSPSPCFSICSFTSLSTVCHLAQPPALHDISSSACSDGARR